MTRDDRPWNSYERLVDALSTDLLDADASEVEGSHAGRGARVQADALRQALRRAAASAPPDDGLPRDILRQLTLGPQGENKP